MTPESVSLLLAALLSCFPGTPQPQRGRIERRHDAIVQHTLDAARAYDVPPGVLLVLGFLESHLGTDAASGGSWGAPIARDRRGVAGNHQHAAYSLRRGVDNCGSWAQAIAFFRCGHCACPRLVGYDPDFAARLTQRVYRRAAVPLPSAFRPVIAARR